MKEFYSFSLVETIFNKEIKVLKITALDHKPHKIVVHKNNTLLAYLKGTEICIFDYANSFIFAYYDNLIS